MVESYEQIKFRKCLQKGRICSENVCKKRQIMLVICALRHTDNIYIILDSMNN